MSDDWKPGDMALCIGANPLYPAEVQPGSIHTIERVWRNMVNIKDPAHLDTAFDLVGVPRLPGDLVYWSGFFVKITPGTKPKGSEIERARFLQGDPWRERV